MKALNAIEESAAETGLENVGVMFQTSMALVMGLLTANLLIRPYKAL